MLCHMHRDPECGHVFIGVIALTYTLLCIAVSLCRLYLTWPEIGIWYVVKGHIAIIPGMNGNIPRARRKLC